VEEREREAEERLEALLEREHERALVVRHLRVDVVLPEREHGDQVRAFPTSARLALQARVAHPCWMATLMKPRRLRSVRSAVPGCAARLSAAPPTTIAIAEPGPARRMRPHARLETEQMPCASSSSRYSGTAKLEVSVSRCGVSPGKAAPKPVASVAKVAIAPLRGASVVREKGGERRNVRADDPVRVVPEHVRPVRGEVARLQEPSAPTARAPHAKTCARTTPGSTPPSS
jgi:hypothetical protein